MTNEQLIKIKNLLIKNNLSYLYSNRLSGLSYDHVLKVINLPQWKEEKYNLLGTGG